MIAMDQWWIDTVGKFGPATVAALVLLTTWAQNRWLNQISRRASQVEDQKFRLALLDRRSEALEKVRFAGTQFWIEGRFDQEGARAVTEALQIAELVFDDAEHVAIADFLKRIWRWQSLDRRLKLYLDRQKPDNDASYTRVVEEISELEEHVPRELDLLFASMKEATRVRSIPPMTGRLARRRKHQRLN